MEENKITIGYDGLEEVNPVMFESVEKYKSVHQQFYKEMLLKKPDYMGRVIRALEKHIADNIPVGAAARSELVQMSDVITVKYLYDPLL